MEKNTIYCGLVAFLLVVSAAAWGSIIPVQLSVPPTVTINQAAKQADPTNDQPIHFTVVFSKNVTGFTGHKVTLTGTAPGTLRARVTGSASTYDVAVTGMTDSGTVNASLATGAAHDAVGNDSKPSTSTDNTVTYDVTPPAISIGAPSALLTQHGPISYSVTYSGAQFVTLAVADVILNTTGTATGTIDVAGSGASTRTVTISGISGDGTLGITLAAGTAVDNVGNQALSADPSANFSVDNTPPIISIGAPSAPLTQGGPISYTVTYSGADAITLTTGDITLNTTGTANGTIGVSGTGTITRTVTISGITGNGTLGIALAANTASDAAGNAALPAGPSASFTVDNSAPTLSISAPSVALTKGGPVTYTITYSGANTITLATGNVTLFGTGTANGTVGVSGTGTSTRTVTISGITGDGTLGISLAVGTATDAAGNIAPLAGSSATFIVDNTAPGLSISAPSSTLTRNGPVTYTITYSGANSIALTAGKVILNGTGTANGTVGVSGTGTTTRTVTISGITGNGTLGIVLAANTASDAAGNTALPAGPSASFTVDNTAPTVSISVPSVALTRNGPVTYTITYSGADTITLAAADVTLNKTGTANGTVGVAGIGTTIRTVTITNITGNGTLGISLAANTAIDGAGNTAPAAGPGTTFTVNNTALTISIGAPSAALTRNGPVSYTVVYGGANTITLTAADVTLNRTGTANGTVGVSGSGTVTRTITITGITGDGTLGISIAAGTATDTVANTTPAAGPSAPFIVDNTAPTLNIGAPSAALTRNGPITYTVTYSGANTISLLVNNITLNKTGTANGTVGVSGSGTTSRTVTITGITGNGTLGISLVANTAADLAGNAALAAGPSATFIVDNTAPAINIGAPSAVLTKNGPITYTVTYSGANTVLLSVNNITLNTTGTANGTVGVSGTGIATRTVTIANITGDGTLGISITAGTATDTAGNSALAAGPSATFTVSNIAPTISISAPSVTLTRNGPVTYTITYRGASSVTLTAGKVTLNGTGTANGTIGVSGTGTTTRTVTITNITGDGTLSISLAVGTATDSVGNSSLAAGPSATCTVDNTAPTLSIGAPSAALTRNGPITYTVTYSGANTVSLTVSHITLNKTGTANGTIGVSGSGTATRTVTITNITGNGTLGIAIAAGTAADTVGNTALAAGPSATFIVNNTALTINIGAPSAALTRNGPIAYTITYGGANSVTLAVGNVTLNKTGTANGTVGVSGTGTDTRTVTIANITGDGTLGISITTGTATDTAGNLAPATGPSTPFTVDNTPPIIGIGAPSVALTQNGPVTYTITYGGANVITLALSDITLNRTGTANGTIGVSGTGTTTRTVTITNITGNGTLGISLAIGTAADTAGNTTPVAGPSATVTVDNTPPALSISAPSTALTRTGPVTYTINYSGANSVTLAVGTVTLNTTGTANGTVGVSGTGTTTRTVTITNITGNGTLGIAIGAGTAIDAAGNTSLAAGPSTPFTVDNTPPTMSIGPPSAVLTRNGPITYTVTYGDPDTVTLAAGNIILNTTGTANGKVGVSGTGTTTRTVTITNITGDGTLGISITANTAVDLAGNTAPAAGPSATCSVDNTPPTVSIGAPSAAKTINGPITYTITYGGASIVTLVTNNVILNKAGTANGTVSVIGSGTATRTVTITNITGDGTLGISIVAGTAADIAGNTAMAAGPGTTFIVDSPLTVTVNQAANQLDPTHAMPVHFTVVFSKAVTDFTGGKVTLTGTAPGNLLCTVTGTGPTYDVAVSGMTDSGTVIASLLANVVHDIAGYANLASTSTNNKVTYISILGKAATFGSFGGGAGMTNQGLDTIITGDIGSTGVSTTMTGFHDSTGDGYTETPLNIGYVTGRIYTDAPPPVIFIPGGPYGGTAVTKAIADKAAAATLAAYNYLAGLPTTGSDPSASGELGGQTVIPGVYKSAGDTFGILPGTTLTLDAQGDANAIWVFQMGSSLTVGEIGAGATPAKVVFKNGVGQPGNVYWQVGSGATINTGAQMVGTIISYASTTLGTAGISIRTTLDGRALALTAAVTMVNTHINMPAP